MTDTPDSTTRALAATTEGEAMIVNYEFFPRPKELDGGFAIDSNETPRKGDTIIIGDRDVYEVADVAWRFGSYESENDGDLTVVVTCDLRT